MVTIVQLLIYGLQLGSVYALLALGYSMVYGVVRMINLAHGDFLMVGAMGTYFLALFFASYMIDGTFSAAVVIIMIIIAMAGTGLLGVGVERIAYRPLRNRPRGMVMITAIGVSRVLQNFPKSLPFIGAVPRPFPALFPDGHIVLGGIQISVTQIILLGVSAALMIILYCFVYRTNFGLQMQAVSMDLDASKLMGIKSDTVISLTFFIGAALAAASGIFYGCVYPQVDVFMGSTLGNKAFIAAVLGGVGDIRGAMLGGLLLGVIEIFASSIDSNFGFAISFVVLIAILLFKPAGLLGKPIVEKV